MKRSNKKLLAIIVGLALVIQYSIGAGLFTSYAEEIQGDTASNKTEAAAPEAKEKDPEPEPEPAPAPKEKEPESPQVQKEAAPESVEAQSADQVKLAAVDADAGQDDSVDAEAPEGEVGDPEGEEAGDGEGVEDPDAVQSEEPTEGSEEIIPGEGEEIGEEADDPDSDEDEDKDDDEYPEVTLTKTVGGVTVTLHAPKGALPKGAKLDVSMVTAEKYFSAVAGQLESEGRELTDAIAFDVTPLNKDGEPVQPHKTVTVTFSGTGLDVEAGGDVDVFRVSDDAGSVTEMGTSDASANTQTFSASHFSIYVVGSSAAGSGTDNSPENRYVLLNYGDSADLQSTESSLLYNEQWDISFDENQDTAYINRSGSTVTNKNTSDHDVKATVIHRYKWAWDVLGPFTEEEFFITAKPQVFTVKFQVQMPDESSFSDYDSYPVFTNGKVENIPAPSSTSGSYTFYGWYTDSACDTLATDADFEGINANKTFYGKYSSSATIHYVAGASPASVPSDLTAGIGTTVHLSSDASRDGYTLKAWKDESGTEYGINEAIEMPEGGLTLYAQWEASQKIRITYRYNYPRLGSDTFSTQNCSIESQVEIIEDVPYRGGNNVFLGWATSGSGDPVYFPKDTYTTNTSDVTLYAVWGSIRTSDLNPKVLNAKSATVTYNGTSQSVEGVTEGSPTNGYLYVGTHDGWGTQNDYTIYAYVSDIKASGTETGHYSTLRAAKLYARRGNGALQDLDQYIEVKSGVLTINQVEVTVSTDGIEEEYDGNPHTAGGSVVVGGDTSTQQTFSHAGGQVTLVNGETLNIKTTGSQTDVGESQNTFEVDWGNPEWGSQATAKNYNYKINKGSIGTLKVKGSEKVKIEYQVAPEHSGTLDKTQEIIDATGEAAGSTATASPGYSFDKWTKGEDTVGTVAHFDPLKNSEDKYEAATYTANFKENDINIKFEADGHGKVTNPSGVTVGGVDVKAEEVSGSKATAEDAYKFDGWYVDGAKISDAAELTSAQVVANLKEAGSTEDYTYYNDTTFIAKFVPIEYTITYNIGNGSTVEGTNPTTYTIESEDITLINPTNSKYTFLGWTGPELSGDTETVTIPKGSTGNREYTAQWQFTVTYHTNYAPDYDFTEVYYGRLGTDHTVKTFTNVFESDKKPDYFDFKGWATSSSATRPEYDTGNKVNDNIDLYAVWDIQGVEQAAAKILYEVKTYEGEDDPRGEVAPAADAMWADWYPLIPWLDDLRYHGPSDEATATAADGFEFEGWYVVDPVTGAEKKIEGAGETLDKDTIRNNLNRGTISTRIWIVIDWLTITKNVYKDTTFIANFVPITNDVTYVISEDSESPSGYEPPEGEKDVAVGTTVTVEDDPSDVKGTNSEGVPGTWVFNGWVAPDGVTVTDGKFEMPANDVEFTGSWTFTPDTYTVTWVNEDGTELEKDENVDYGAIPSYDGEEPTKSADAQYTYTFAGWDPDIAEVTKDAKYTATYDKTVNKYTVTFKDEDGSVISEAEYEYGTAAADIETPDDPTKAATAQYTYTFAGWDPEIAEVTKDATYTAKYTETLNKYTVTFVDEDGSVISEKEYEYGTAAADIEKPADPTKASDSENTYEFAGWDPEIAEVTEDATYTATYTATPIPDDPDEPDNPDDDDDDDNPAAAAAAAAAPPAGPAAPAEDIEDEPAPQAEPPATTIEDEPTPMANTWSVANAVLAVITAVGAALALFRKREDADEYEDEDADRKMLIAKIAGALAGVAAPVTFFVTENLGGVAAAFDKWSPLMVGILGVQVVAAILNNAASKGSEFEEEAETE